MRLLHCSIVTKCKMELLLPLLTIVFTDIVPVELKERHLKDSKLEVYRSYQTPWLMKDHDSRRKINRQLRLSSKFLKESGLNISMVCECGFVK